MNQNIEANKKNAVAFYQAAYEGRPDEAVDKFVGEEYIQHNPDVKNGRDGFVEYFTQMQEEFAEKNIRFLRVIGEGDMVALHTHQTWPGNEEYVTMDFFRFDNNGKIIEHWDSIQKVPDYTKNGNSMY